MSSTNGSVRVSSTRKLQPQARMPDSAALQRLSPDEVATLERRLLERIECVYDPGFQQPDAEDTLLGPLPVGPEATSDDSGIDLLAGITGRSLTAEQEQHLFLRFNYCRYRIMRILREFRGRRLTTQAARDASESPFAQA